MTIQRMMYENLLSQLCDTFPLKGQSNEIFIIWTSLGHWPMGWNIFDFGQVFAELFKFLWISPGCDTAQSQSPQGVIPRRVIWQGSSFFHNSRMPESLRKGLKYFRFWLRFCRVIQIFRQNLPRVLYCEESISQGDHMAQSHSWPLGVKSHFLKRLHKPLNGQCHKNKYGFIFYYLRASFFIFEKSCRIKNVFDFLGYDTPGGVKPENQIIQRILN